MNQVTNEQKETVTKILAIVGFLAAIVLLVFIAVKAVSFIPSAFSSLASIADSVYNYERNPSLEVTTPNSVIKSGESFAVTWNNVKRPGTYSFSYLCADGVRVEVRNMAGEILPLTCGEGLTLEKDQTSIDVMVITDAQRFTDVTYRVLFTASDPRLEGLSTESKITIVNASIPTSTGVATKPETTPTEENSNGAEATPEPTAPVKPTQPIAGTPTYVEEVIYAIPTSNPNGTIDLRVTLIGIGTLEGKNFTKTQALEAGEGGALRFSVKNIGTKTSNEWSFKAELPADIDYTSGDQKALKPNEEAIITLSFTGTDRTGSEEFGITATTKGDVNSKNNSFTATVKVND